MTQLCNEMTATPCCNIQEAINPKFFKALGDPTRVGLLARIAQLGGPCTVGEVAACCPIDLSVVSRHLAILREIGILESEKRGKEVWYRVRYHELAATLRAMADAIERCCPEETPNERKYEIEPG
jgi:DNA-binding transcriptional ArsR family regulator